jgi:hypothetical protein
VRVGFIGGMPAILGGGGLEIQMDQTASALKALGLEVVRAHERASPCDVIHAFGADPSTWNHLRNWNSFQAPLVISPVLVVSSGLQRRVEPLASRLRFGMTTTANMRRTVVRSASHLVALHEGERRDLIEWYQVSESMVSVIGNGSDARVEDARPDLARDGFVVVGTVGDRKRQLDLVQAWLPEWPPLSVVGPMTTGWKRRSEFERLVGAKSNVRWIGKLERHEVWQVQSTCIGTISASVAEGESLALLDSLRLGTPVFVREGHGAASLFSRFGRGVSMFDSMRDLAQLVESAQHRKGALVPIKPPTWQEVGESLIDVYRRVLSL